MFRFAQHNDWVLKSIELYVKNDLKPKLVTPTNFFMLHFSIVYISKVTIGSCVSCDMYKIVLSSDTFYAYIFRHALVFLRA